MNNKKFTIFLSTLTCLTLLFSFNSCYKLKQQKSKSDHGFISIFDGKTLNNWKGDSTYWNVQNGNLVGTVTPKTILKRNTFIIWQGGQPDNFELKLEYKISESGNSGINYRSKLLGNNPFALQGYQCDIDGKNKYTGQNYEEKKRTTLAYLGERVVINTQRNPDASGNLRTHVKKNCWQTRDVVDTLGEIDYLKLKIKSNDWNKVHLIVNANKLQHYVNGTLMSEVIDNDAINKSSNGFIGVQVHVGPPMQVMFRNIKLKTLKSSN